MEKPKLYFSHQKNTSLEEILLLENRLLKEEEDSFLLFYEIDEKAIVLGTSNKETEHLNEKLLKEKPLKVLRRKTGGGSVVVDNNTLFVTFIIEKKALNFNFPEELFAWSEKFYTKAFQLKDFCYKERDYLIGNKKCGGNAQYLTKNKWLHQTSFLWDFDLAMMDYLSYPPKVPSYRENRNHRDFLIPLKDYFLNKDSFFVKVKSRIDKDFELINFNLRQSP